MMKIDDLLDTYYFTKVNRNKIDELVRDFPSVFTKEKKVPLNFQLRLSEITDRTSIRYSERKERQSFQNRASKIDLRRRYMIHVLDTREEHKVFEALCDEEDSDRRIWFYIEESQDLQGPSTCQEMQELFEQKKLKPGSLLKKKMGSEFTQACYLLNKYCRMKLASNGDGSSLAHFSSPKSKKLQIAENLEERDLWLKVIGKRPDMMVENPLMSTSRPTSFSGTHSGYREERLSLSFMNPQILDGRSKQEDPSKLFDEQNKHEYYPNEEGYYGGRKKRNSLILESKEGGYQNHSGHGQFRKRVATTNYRKTKK